MRLRNVLTTAALLGPAPALAQSVEVASTGLSFPNITEAMAAALPGDTLIVSAGIYAEDVVVDKDITIEGVGADLVTLTGLVAGSIIEVNLGFDLTLTDLTLDAAARRGVNTVDGSLITVERVVFNTGTGGSGGALQLFSSDLVVTDSTFLGRTAGASGGAIFTAGSGSDIVDVSNSTFTMGGVGSTKGGAIHASSVSVVCTDCWIDGATASSDGGAIFATGSVTLFGGSISGSSALNGGAVYIDGGSLTVEGTAFIGNTAIVDGGAIVLVNPSIFDISGAHFCGNSADDGGAIYGTASISPLIYNSTFVENDASSGGAVYLAGVGSWTLENLTLLGNDSGGTGAVQVGDTPLTIQNTLFAHNAGYAVSRSGTTEPVVQYSAFYLNSSGNVANVALDGGEILGIDPRLSSYTENGDCADDELWPSVYSPLLDMGHPDPAYQDPDGSRNDIGAYGGPSADTTRHLTDADADGFSVMQDCDDAVDTTFPGADEICNLVDDDCDEEADEAAIDAITWYPDADGDGYGDWSAAVGITQCDPPLDHVADYTDCNDDDPATNPGVDETCASGDLNCDGDDQLGSSDATTWTFDHDLDGHGAIATALDACASPGPTYLEMAATDCDDSQAGVNPDAVDVCNMVDDNCSGDEEDAIDAVPWYLDSDGDTFGDENAVAEYACFAPADTVGDNSDCDDNQGAVFPGNPEVCDGLDNDCTGDIDDGGEDVTWYPDTDGDGFGADGLSVASFCAPEASGWLLDVGGDCDDGDAAVFVGAAEVCDGVDNDCDGKTDDTDDDVQGTEAWLDFDGDGFGAGVSEIVCDLTGYATTDADCSDLDPEINPDAVDVAGNDLDEDCDGRALDSEATGSEGLEDEPGGCGCSHSAPATGWLLPLLGLALVRRRSR